jgi:hypothetical protein
VPAGFLLFLGFVLFFYLQGGYRITALGQIRFELIVALFLAAISLVALFGDNGPSRIASPSARAVAGWIIALLSLSAVMTVASQAPSISWERFVDKVLKHGMLTLFIVALVTSPGRLRWFFGTYLLAFLKMAQEGVLGLVNGGLIWENQGTMRLHGSTPLYAHPNSFSGTQLSTLPLLKSFFPVVGWRIRAVLGLQAFAAAIVVVTTGSRTGYVALVVWLAFVVIQSRYKFKTMIALALLGAAVVPVLPEDYLARFETIFSQKDAEGESIELRKEIYRDAMHVLARHPLGVGVGAFSAVRQEMFGRKQEAHQLYLEVACDLGIPGLVVFCGLLVSMMTACARASRSAQDQLSRVAAVHPRDTEPGNAEQVGEHKEDLAFIKASGHALLGFLVVRLALGLFGHDFYEVYWWFAAGSIIALHRMLAVAEQRTRFLLSAHSSSLPTT